jgi:transcriptional regulator with XRE-family HTH domain
MDNWIDIGQQIKSLRIAKGWSRDDLAKKIRASVKYVKQVETGKRDIVWAGNVRAFEKALGQKLDVSGYVE